MDEVIDEKGDALLDRLAENWTPREMRDLASTLLRLADSLDQDWEPPQSKSIFRWPNALTRIEKNALNLAMKARLIYDSRRKRRELIPAEYLGEPAWDMLLELFMQYSGGAKVSTSSLCIASDCPQSTALRYIAELEKGGMVKRSSSHHDKRVNFVELTDKGIIAVGTYLDQH
ncbi:helix-turn-helix domain-containing protein [Alteraurantiacibacter aquimixticola]|nr:MarR family transcriptional regulator [Alteraurantiacibacter aquimixticola]